MNDDKLMRQFSIEYQYRSHGQHTGEHVPQPKSGRVMGPAEISGRKKLEVGCAAGYRIIFPKQIMLKYVF